MSIKKVLDEHLKWLCGEEKGSRADLRGANLREANLREADLRVADLCRADLYEADLRGADLPSYKICPEKGSFRAFKALSGGLVIEVEVFSSAKRTNSLTGRKCRASKIKCITGPSKRNKCLGWRTEAGVYYYKGAIVEADSFDDDIRLECTNGIHFFMTKEEAEEWAN